LLAGDIIIAFDGEEIGTSADLPHVVGLIAPGTQVRALIVREGVEQTLTVAVGGLGADQVARVDAGVSADGTVSLLGMRTAAPDPGVLSALGLAGGVVVEEVTAGSPADEAGVIDGDIVTRVGSRAIGRMQDMEDVLAEIQPGSSVPVRLIRGGSPLFIGIRVPDNE